jgi:hypothetical protein
MIECSWLKPDDIIITDDWVILDDEIDGTTQGRFWVKNKRTGGRALFKPENDRLRQAHVEYAVSCLGIGIGIRCARVQVGEIDGAFGCLSFDETFSKRHRISDGDSLYRCDSFFNNKKSDTNKKIYDSPAEISFKGLLPYISKETERDLFNMLYLDCIISNCDRHGGNYSFLITPHRVIGGLVDLYDHGLSLWNSLRDVSLFPYEGHFELSFKETYKLLCRDYWDWVVEFNNKLDSDEIISLMNEVECYDFMREQKSKIFN